MIFNPPTTLGIRCQEMNNADGKLNEIVEGLADEPDVDAVMILVSVRDGNRAQLLYAVSGSPHTQIGMLSDMKQLVSYNRDVENSAETPGFA